MKCWVLKALKVVPKSNSQVLLTWTEKPCKWPELILQFPKTPSQALSPHVLVYLRGTFHQPPLFFTVRLFFLSCWLHLKKKLIFRTGKLCSGSVLGAAKQGGVRRLHQAFRF